MRHYEIIAAGAVPLFEDLDSMPTCVAARLPRDMLQHGQALFDEIVNGSSPQSIANKEKDEELLHSLPANWTTSYNQLQDKLMSYAEANLTTRALAKQWMTSTRLPQGGKVLWLASLMFGEVKPSQPFCHSDYLRDMLFHGLRRAGTLVVDVPRLDFMYQNSSGCDHLFGNGYSYAGLLPTEDADVKLSRLNWKDVLAKGGFDHVIFSTTAGHFIYPVETFGPLSIIESGLHNDPQKTSMVFGDDPPIGGWYSDKFPEFLRRGHIFVREGFV
eukprot:gnl/TRDRNA2_/TRDRNA2_167795_c0_seq1.p1 gnl/TRDRNA2_/TRDRNA2_167795_c0~~gnl/TRDRNA2_/TRDRNA2_167795_c0_seq1.p1  ORF type:complete len:272 (-),score=40.37 gnl/TRDRNA2_/TRDRNA2_167795_c0_seq1:84-899(-)